VSKPATEKAKALDKQVKEAFEAAETVVDKGVDIVADTANSGVKALQTLKDSTSSKIKETARRASSAVEEGAADLSDIVENASESVSESYTDIKETTTTAASNTLSALKNITTKVKENLIESINEPSPELPDVPTIDAKGIREVVATPETDLSNLPDVASKVGNAYEDLKSLLSKATKNLTESINEPSIELPDMPELDAKGIKEALKLPEPDLKNLIAAEDKKNKVPTMIRQFLYDITGGEEPLTEKDLLTPELEFLTSQALQGKTNLQYADYSTEGKGQSQYADVGGGGGIIDFFKKLNDPAYSMKTTLGQANIIINEKGESVVTDTYNFNDSTGAFNLLQFVKGIKNAGFSPYAQARNVASQLGSGKGEGSKVEINLGKLDMKEQKRAEKVVAGL